jgi:sugar phosphate permease
MFASVGIPASLAYGWLAQRPPHEHAGRRIRITDVFKLFQHPFMWVVGVVQYIRLGVFSAISFWLPSLLIEEKGLSMQVTGLIIALRTLLSAPSNMIGGYVSDRIKNPYAVISTALAGIAISTALMVKADDIVAIIVLNGANAVFIQSYFGPLIAIPVEKYGSHMTGTLTGFGNFFANLGGFSSTYLLGLIKDKTGYFESGFYGIAAACLLGLVTAFLLKKMAKSAKETAPVSDLN